MITQIFLQLDDISGIQLKVLNELKKNNLKAIKHVIKDAPNGGKLLAMEVESEGRLNQEHVQDVVGPIQGVRAVLKVTAREVSAGPDMFLQAQELMVNSTQAFTHPVRSAAFVKELKAAQSTDDLKALVDRWYSAISDNPDGALRVDELRADLLNLLR